MNISDLKKIDITKLNQIAIDMKIEDPSSKRKQDLIFDIL